MENAICTKCGQIITTSIHRVEDEIYDCECFHQFSEFCAELYRARAEAAAEIILEMVSEAEIKEKIHNYLSTPIPYTPPDPEVSKEFQKKYSDKLTDNELLKIFSDIQKKVSRKKAK